jgi:hypothetical protein
MAKTILFLAIAGPLRQGDFPRIPGFDYNREYDLYLYGSKGLTIDEFNEAAKRVLDVNFHLEQRPLAIWAETVPDEADKPDYAGEALAGIRDALMKGAALKASAGATSVLEVQPDGTISTEGIEFFRPKVEAPKVPELTLDQRVDALIADPEFQASMDRFKDRFPFTATAPANLTALPDPEKAAAPAETSSTGSATETPKDATTSTAGASTTGEAAKPAETATEPQPATYTLAGRDVMKGETKIGVLAGPKKQLRLLVDFDGERDAVTAWLAAIPAK